MQCPSGASQFVMLFIALLQLTSGFLSVALCSLSKIKIKVSQKATSIAAVNWLACYPHSAAWLLRPSGHGFCSALHACQHTHQSHKHLLTAQKTKTHASHLCFQHSCKPSSFVGL